MFHFPSHSVLLGIFLDSILSLNKMQPLPPPPPPYTPPPVKQTKPSPSCQEFLYKQASNQQISTTEVPQNNSKPRAKQQILGKPRRTNPVVWCGAILCLLFSILLIFFGVATLVIFLAIRPRHPVFDIPAASLRVIYFDSPEFLNGDMAFLANFSNPNRKLNVRFEHLYVEIYFSKSLIATQALQPFSQRPGEVRVAPVRLISSLVYLPPNLALGLQKQEQRNRIVYDIKGTFKVKIKLGSIHYSYWLHSKCQIEMTSPPTGVLIRHRCRTKR